MDVYCILIKVGWFSLVICLSIVLTLFQLLLRHSLCNKLRSISARRVCAEYANLSSLKGVNNL